MQFEHPSFPEGSAPSSHSNGGAAPHPSHQAHPHPSSAPHPHPHHYYPHYPYPSRFSPAATSYTFFSWPRVGFWGGGGYNPAFAAPAFPGVAPPPPPPPPGTYPHPHYGSSPWSNANYRTWRRSYRRGPRLLPFLLLAGGGIFAYRKLKHEIGDVKAAVAASNEQAAAVLTQRQADRCGRRHHWGGGWRDQEVKWAEWQALMAQQRSRVQPPQQQQEVPQVEVPKQEEKPLRWI
ncbi:hypothetical protein JCM11251_000266 [Rhodosporidiobolus azoricus]